jgi:hypothetical protein
MGMLASNGISIVVGSYGRMVFLQVYPTEEDTELATASLI